MSARGCFPEDTSQHLRRIQRQVRLLDLRLQLLREKLLAARLQRMMTRHRCCLQLPEPRPPARRALPARLDVERRVNRIQRFSRTLNSSHSQCHLALIDMKDFEPRDVSVEVKDGKVTVLAEHREERNTPVLKTCNYRKFMKEFNLPPGVSDDEVTYSLESNSVMKIETAPKGCPQLQDY
ncbi:outer dense fiber protein 1 [Manacus candei]|uniref:outer dense fiber protein 1 n=1 Tax=Manacus candei TaxID=415023 RepID=UPI00222645E4|nr:outer dense fiber protein 1 [Manacus candei]